MNKSNKPHAAWQWNPPHAVEFADEPLDREMDVSCLTECTGLMQRIPGDESAARALCDLHTIHTLKPCGNPGKDNPRNDPSEIRFHRDR